MLDRTVQITSVRRARLRCAPRHTAAVRRSARQRGSPASLHGPQLGFPQARTRRVRLCLVVVSVEDKVCKCGLGARTTTANGYAVVMMAVYSDRRVLRSPRRLAVVATRTCVRSTGCAATCDSATNRMQRHRATLVLAIPDRGGGRLLGQPQESYDAPTGNNLKGVCASRR